MHMILNQFYFLNIFLATMIMAYQISKCIIQRTNFKSLQFDFEMTTRGALNNKERAVYAEKLTMRGEYYYETHYIGKQLGKGGFATCFEIYNSKDDKKNAVKVIPKQSKNHSKQENIEKIKEEISIISSLDHPGIVKYIDDFQDNQSIYIVLQLCNHGSLCDILKKRGCLTEPQTRYFVAQIVDIMKYIKMMNIIHRDIKLANYFLDQNFRLKLGDFGLATKNDHSSKSIKKLCGTPNYIAPEIIEKKSYGFQVDIWSTGVLIFTLLYGVPPFETKSTRETYDKIRKCIYKFEGAHRNIQCSDEAKDFIQQILCIDPMKRLKIQDFMSHPFLSRYKIPQELEISFPVAQPSQSFLKIYGRAIKKKQMASISKELSSSKQAQNTMAAGKPESKVQQVTYKNALLNGQSGSKTKEKATDKFEKKQGKKLESIAQKKEGPFTTPQKKLKVKTEAQVNKSQSSSFDFSDEHLKGRKKFRVNNDQDVQQTKRKPITKDKVEIKPIPQQNECQQQPNDDWARPLIAFKLKHVDRQKQNKILNQKQLKIIFWINCTHKYGLAYVLSNHQIGFYFNDASRMIYSAKDNVVHYVYRKQKETVHRQIQKEEVDYLQKCKDKIYSKIQILNFYHRTLRLQYPLLQSIQNEAQLPLHIKSFKFGEKLAIFKLSDNNMQFFFEDATTIFASFSSNFITYNANGKTQIVNLPLTERTVIQPDFKDKIRHVFKFYSKFLPNRQSKDSPECENLLLWHIPSQKFSNPLIATPI